MKRMASALVLLAACSRSERREPAPVPALPVEVARVAYAGGPAVEDPCRAPSAACGLCAEARPLLRELVDGLRDDVIERFLALQGERTETQWRQRRLWAAVATEVETVAMAAALASLPRARGATDDGLQEARACLVRLGDPAFAQAERAAYIAALRAGCGGPGVR